MTTPIFLCCRDDRLRSLRVKTIFTHSLALSLSLGKRNDSEKKNDCNDGYDWILQDDLSHRICNDMSAYDTYGHTHCSMFFTAFICSGNTNEKRKICITKNIDNNEHHQF